MRREAWEIKTIQDIATQIFNGAEVTRAQLGTGDYPAVKCGDINSKLAICFDECVSFVDEGLLKNRKYFEKGDLLISNLHHKIEDAGAAVAYCGDRKCLAGSDVTVIKHNQNPRYLAYILSSEFCRKQITKSLITGSTVIHLYASKIKQIKIPLPPRPIQDLIADILDKWTYLQEELARELARELECRKKQYQYYKELVLRSEANKWGYKTVEEIAKDIYCGDEVSKIQLGKGTFPAIKCGDITSKLNLHFSECYSFVNEADIKRRVYFETGDILIAEVGDKQKVGSATAYIGTQRGILGKAVYALKHNQNPKYLAYALSASFCRTQINSFSCGGAILNIYIKSIKKIKIPLPPLEEQERIVSLLDPLYEMCGDAEKGIPALISVIKKQYQYYKEELLKVQENLS